MDSNFIKLVFSAVLLIAAFVFTFIFPSSGIETTFVSILAALGSTLGINWRTTYDEVKSWISSKTIVGAIIILISFLILAASSLGLFNLGNDIQSVLLIFIGAGGFTFLIGVINAIVKKNK